jgi:hypothetical protein
MDGACLDWIKHRDLEASNEEEMPVDRQAGVGGAAG